MPDQLAAFLQYGYGTIKDEGVALLTLYAASLAFLAAFSDKVLNIAEAPSEIRDWVNIGLYALIAAVAMIFLAAGLSQWVLNDLELWLPKPKPLPLRLANASYPLLFCKSTLCASVICYIAGLIAVFTGSLKMNVFRRQKETKQRKEEERFKALQQEVDDLAQKQKAHEAQLKVDAAKFDESVEPLKHTNPGQ